MPEPAPAPGSTDPAGHLAGAHAQRAGAAPDAVPAPTAPAPTASVMVRIRRRSLLLAALLGVLIGVAVPTGIGAVEWAAGRARSDGLRALATAYLSAIAAGESDAATALVPLPVTTGATVPRAAADEVLQAAIRIRDPAVQLVHSGAQDGAAVVRYRLAGRSITRTLEAEHVDGAWRFIASLAEPVAVQRLDPMATASVAGVDLAGGVVHLYPGVYRFDVASTELIEFGGEQFAVDGDPTTRTEAYVGAHVAPAVQVRALEVARAAVDACQAQAGCAVPPEAEVRILDGVHLVSADRRSGAIDMAVSLEIRMEELRRGAGLRITLQPGEDGGAATWLCSQPGALEHDLAACPP